MDWNVLVAVLHITAFEYGLADAISISREMVTDEIGKIVTHGKKYGLPNLIFLIQNMPCTWSRFHALFTQMLIISGAKVKMLRTECPIHQQVKEYFPEYFDQYWIKLWSKW